jgi:hypothetical protein
VKPSKLAIVACLLFVAASARAQEPRPPRPTASKQAGQEGAFLKQMGEAQQWLGEQTWHVRDGVERLHAEWAAEKDRDAALEAELKALREEVKGLYVESSAVKQEIEALKEEIGGVDTNISNFRTISGFFIGVMILLLGVIFLVTIRR